MLQCAPCFESGYAAREGMARCTPCAGHYQMPAGAIASTSDQDCVCVSGYIAGCTWPVWQLLVVIIAAMVVAILVYMAWKRCRTREEGEHELQERVRLLRRLLRLRPEHGFRFTTEPRSWAQWLGLAPHRPINARPLKHLAMLSLLRRFDVAAVDSLSVLFEALDEQHRDRMDTDNGFFPGSPASRRPASISDHRHFALCNIIINVSCQLLDPRCLKAQAEDGALPVSTNQRRSSAVQVAARRLSSASGTESNGLLLVVVPDKHSPEERFIFFRKFVAQLQMWEGGDAFVALKAQLQLSLDALRGEMDALYDTLVAEEGGRELIAWNPPVAHHEDDSGAIQRQDHPCVMAILFHQHTKKQMALFEEVSMAQQASLGLRKRLDPGSPVRLRFDSESRQSRSGSALSILSQCGASLSSSGTLGDAGGAEWVCKPGQVERQFVEQLHLQSCLLNDSFQLAVQDSIAARTLELEQRQPASLKGTEQDQDSTHIRRTADSELTPHMQVYPGSIKTVMRMLEKVKTYAQEARAGNAQLVEPYTGHVLDPVRACVVCRNSKDLLETAKWMLDNGTRCALPAVRVKNKFAVKDSSEYDGYRDLMLSVLHTGPLGLRIVGELQFHDERMYALKIQMHRLYKVKRAASASSI
mmetsp:Transcript_61853/g.145475  ORF Transcript_61853/g.145475 Transcript_61853/m.145475 type:complete len:642 (-) Transcript_61853:135-2060(-)